MFNRSFFTGAGVFFFYMLLLSLDATLGIHVFSLGFLLTLVFFVPNYQAFIFFLILGFLHDVRFQLPLGVSFLLITPYILLFPFLLQVIRSRMLVLYGYLIVIAFLLLLIHYQESVSPFYVLLTLICGLVWVISVYFYAIHRYQDFSFNTKKKSIRW